LVCGQNCPECEKPTIFTVRYDNPTHSGDVVRIEVYKKIDEFGESGKLLAEFDGVTDGQEITIDSRVFINNADGTVESNTAYRVIFENEDETGVSIHTSCSQDLFVGDVHLGDFGVSFTVVSGMDADLNPTIPDASCRDPCDCDKPTIFTVRYDNPTNSGVEVRIEVYKGENDFDTEQEAQSKILAEFDGVMDGDEITIDSRDFINDDKDTVHSNTVYRVLVGGVEEVAVVVIHTSCSDDNLFVDNVYPGDFGVSFTIISGTDASLNPTVPPQSCRI
jgi:hypothetical protein